MALSGFNYLYTLATLSVMFVGFSALVITLRQTLGEQMSRLDILLMKIFIELGFIVVAAALLPSILALLQSPEAAIWRVSSALVAPVIGVFAITYPVRRKTAAAAPTPPVVWAYVAALLLASAVLFANASAIVVETGSGWYAVALTAVFFISGLAYLQALSTLHRDHPFSDSTP